jgi:hypothetical protein
MQTSSLYAPIKAIPEAMAVEKGAELLTEIAVYSTLFGVAFYEYGRMTRDNAAKAALAKKEQSAVLYRIESLENKMTQVHAAMDELNDGLCLVFLQIGYVMDQVEATYGPISDT